jgi:hypothetical protein
MVRYYIRAYGLCVVYVLLATDGEVGVGVNAEAMLRRRERQFGAGVAIAANWWCQDRKTASRVAEAVNMLALDPHEAIQMIPVAAQNLTIVAARMMLWKHAHVTQWRRLSASSPRCELGGLRPVSCAYREERLK